MTISPNPNMPKLLAANPFSSISIGNVTIERRVREEKVREKVREYIQRNKTLTFYGSFK